MKKFKSVYPFPTENLSYLSQFITSGCACLLPTSSGDAVLDAIGYGSKQIVGFDINENSPRYARLKLKLISRLSYEQYWQIMNDWENLNYDPLLLQKQLHKLKPAFRLPDMKFNGKYSYLHWTSHLTNQALFEKVKAGISAMKLDWITADAKNLAPLFHPASFDFISLSNLADYSHKMFKEENHVELFAKKIVLPLLPLLNSKGKLLVAYVYDVGNKANSGDRNPFNYELVRNSHYDTIPGFRYTEEYFPSVMGTGFRDGICWLEKLD